MEAVLIILGIILIFVFFGLFGWIVKAFGKISEFLMDGCASSFRFFFWLAVILTILILMFL